MHPQLWTALTLMFLILMPVDKPRWALPALAVLSAGLVASVAWQQSWLMAVAVGSCFLLAFAVALKWRQRGPGKS